MPRRQITELEYLARVGVATPKEKNCLTCKHDEQFGNKCAVYKANGEDEWSEIEVWAGYQTWLDLPDAKDNIPDTETDITVPDYGCVNCPGYEQKDTERGD